MSEQPPGPRPRPYVRAFAGSEDDFPTYILKTLGRDREWMEKGSCRGHDLAKKRAWTVRPADKVTVGDNKFTGARLIEAALKICGGCPVQYECAIWAFEIREESGTWAMPHDDLLWLTRQPDGEGIIHKARLDGITVQVAVRSKLSERRRAARDAVSSAV